MNDNTDYRRVYIPKGDSEWRPLGVPSLPWRIYMHMFNNFLTIFLTPHLLPSQHGFIPGRGTLSAWKEIMDKVINKAYIYECDLKQCFPSVNVTHVTDQLEAIGMPKRTLYWLENVNRVAPKLPMDQKMDESRVIESEQDKYDLAHGIFRPESKMYDVFREINNDALLFEITGLDNWFEILQQQWAILDSFGGATVSGQFLSLPQGLATSPILSILTLRKFLTQPGILSISYADDPIFYSDNPFTPKDAPPEIKFNEEKSFWVKKNNIWLKPLKYLGLEYDPWKDTIKGSTRNGTNTLELDKKLENAILSSGSSRVFIKGDLSSIMNECNGYNSNKPRSIWRSSIMGLLQSRLYSDSWNIPDIHQDFKWRPAEGSWGQKKNVNIFNASSKAINWLVSIDKRPKIRKIRPFL